MTRSLTLLIEGKASPQAIRCQQCVWDRRPSFPQITIFSIRFLSHRKICTDITVMGSSVSHFLQFRGSSGDDLYRNVMNKKVSFFLSEDLLFYRQDLTAKMSLGPSLVWNERVYKGWRPRGRGPLCWAGRGVCLARLLDMGVFVASRRLHNRRGSLRKPQ